MTDKSITQDQLNEGLAAAEHAAEQKAVYEHEARIATWTEAFVRLHKSAETKTFLDKIGDFLATEGPSITQAETELAQRKAKYLRAQVEESDARTLYNQQRGTGTAMRQMVIDDCNAKGLPIPQDPEPHLPTDEPAGERPLGGAA
jgi:hypothetical protein